MHRAVIIDDEPWTREVVKHLGKWKELGIEVIGEASDGAYGRELIARLTPDIIITDISMPQLNGIELITRLREEGNTAKVIVISGHDDFAFIRGALKLGVIDYLLKPVRPDELNAQLRLAVDQLAAESRVISGEGVDVLLDAPWTPRYLSLRSGVFESLRSEDTQGIQRAFRSLSEFFAGIPKEELTRGVMIGLFYGLLEGQHRFIGESGYTVDDLFESQEATFVFSSGVQVQDLLDHMEGLYRKTAMEVVRRQHERKRLDIRQVEAFIRVRTETDGSVTLEETAERFFVSREHLGRLFKQEFKESFSDFSCRLRMEKARDRIGQGMPIKEVSARSGYQEIAHFYKAFKQHFGITPGDMQRQVTKEQ